MPENTEKIRKERIKNIVHLVRLSPSRDQDEMVERFTKGEPSEFVEMVKKELSKFELEVTHHVEVTELIQTDYIASIIFNLTDFNNNNGITIALTSYDNSAKHELLGKLAGKRIKVIIRELKD